MFTGIVQAIGTVTSRESNKLSIQVPDAWPDEAWGVGESLAVDGCCLTIVTPGQVLEFDVTDETLSRTTLERLTVGSKVNLERAMRPTDRFGGHIVQGHIDTVAKFVSREANGVFSFKVDDEWARYLVDKGSIAIAGVSLTVIQPKGGSLSVACIPHTLEITTLGGASPGDVFNVEFDVLAKYALNLR